MGVEPEGPFVEVVTQVGQPFGVLDDTVEMVAVDDPQALAVGGGVHGLVHHIHPAKPVAHKMPGELVMVAGHKHHLATFAGAAQDFLHHIVVALRPEPFSAQLPAVNDVTHQVQLVAGVGLQKCQQGLGLAAGCAQVQVRHKDRSQTRSWSRCPGIVVVLIHVLG